MDADQRHTLMQEAATIEHSLDIARRSEGYHLAGARRAHERADSLEQRLTEIQDELAR